MAQPKIIVWYAQQHLLADFRHHGEFPGQQLIGRLALSAGDFLQAAAAAATVLNLLAEFVCKAAQGVSTKSAMASSPPKV